MIKIISSAIGVIDINVDRHPKYSIVIAPKDSPITPPAANMDVRIPWAIDSLCSGNLSRISAKVIGNTDIPIPWNMRTIIIVEISGAIIPKKVATV